VLLAGNAASLFVCRHLPRWQLIGVRFTEAEEGDGLDAQPIAGNPNAIATMPLPINVMIVDATGQATCALISGPGQVTFRYS
jgi:hypothetical protein